MSVSNPAYPIPRWSLEGMEGMWVKMWDPPTESPATPDWITPTNPVPEVMAAAGLADPPSDPHTLELDLLNGETRTTWDGLKQLAFYEVGDKNLANLKGGTYPGTTIRVPRGAIFHATTDGKGPPPHTIHWHGLEPTPMNDGVGHCSMEIGSYTYQLQPSFIGSYFYHCHRNTMQHFEFGLYGLFLVEPPDAYFATLWDPTIPIGHCRDGKRRIAANLTDFPQFPDFIGGDIRDPDPEAGNPDLPASLKFLSNPHAMTVAYDVEALWVFDDRDSVWSDLASNARATYPVHGTVPGYNDNFTTNAGDPVLPGSFFAFNDYRADYWYVTGVPVPAHEGGTAAIAPGIVANPELNSGVSGSQVSVEAYVGQTILFRVLDAAYNNCVYRFPFDIVIIAWDGRALGVAPYGFNNAYVVPANTPIKVSVGRRFDALARFTTAGNHQVECKFIDTRGSDTSFERVVCTALVPVNVSPLTVTMSSDKASPQPATSAVTFTAAMTGTPGSQAPTSGAYEYEFWRHNGISWTKVQDYSTNSNFVWDTTPAAGIYTFQVNIRSLGSTAAFEAFANQVFQITVGAATDATLVADKTSPQPNTTSGGVTFTATGIGGSGAYEFEFWTHNGTNWTKVQDYSSDPTWVWDTTGVTPFIYTVQVNVRSAGSTAAFEAFANAGFQITPASAVGATLVTDKPSPQPTTTPGGVTFTATGEGGSGSYEFEFWTHNGTAWTKVQDYSANSNWLWNTVVAAEGVYTIQVNVRSTGSTVSYESFKAVTYKLTTAATATSATIVPDKTSPQPTTTPGGVTFTATGEGGSGSYEFEFWLHNGTSWTKVQNMSATSTWNWNTAAAAAGIYTIQVNVRRAGSTASYEAFQATVFELQ
ncbi:MAG: multicopper oxidase domain-containing protein [Geobacteraceae bacterium]